MKKSKLFTSIFIGKAEYKFLNYGDYFVVLKDGFIDFKTFNINQLRLYRTVLENQRRKYA